MTNKDNLQQELKEKVKPGIKPSDLRSKLSSLNKGDDIKKGSKKPVKSSVSPSPISISEDEGYESDNSTTSIPTPPPLPNLEIKNLQEKIKVLQRQIQVYQDFKESDLKIKE